MKNNIIAYLRKKKNKLKIRAILMLALLLGLNTYAWFIYITTVNNQIKADVIGWNVSFSDDENEIINNIFVPVDSMYPGMENFTKDYELRNGSKFPIVFSYNIKTITLFGDNYSLQQNDFTSEEIYEILTDGFPFKINFSTSTDTVNARETLPFTISVMWDYESSDEFVKLNKFYKYYENLTYYKKIGDSYIETEINETNFASELENDLYYNADDADTYWGEKSFLFKEEHPDDAPLTFEISLRAEQARE